MDNINFKKITTLIIGVVIGALIFSYFNPSTKQVVYTYPKTPQTSVEGKERTINSIEDFNNAFIEIAEAVNPTVVTVFTEKVFKMRTGFGQPFFFDGPFSEFFEDFFGRQPDQGKQREFRRRGLGSGVIVDEEGHVLTNHHVVAEADTIQIRFLNKKVLPAEVIGADPKTDIAVLKVNADNLPVIDIGNSDEIKVGEWVLAIGSPMSANLAHSVSCGIVSAKGRSNVGLADYEDFIQTDAAINPGNSGGALVSLNGELIGINTAIASRSGGFQGIGFAVPINMARNVMESLIKHGKVIRGWLGVYIQDVNEAMVEAMGLSVDEGALIADIVKDGPADEAGLKEEDLIIEFKGEKITNATELRNSVAETPPGTKVEVVILRNNKEKTITVELGKLGGEEMTKKQTERIEDVFGFSIASFTADMANKYNLDKSLEGVIVTKISQASQAYRAGLRVGDLIVSVNRKKLESVNDFRKVIQNIKEGDSLFFRIVRENRGFFLAFTL